MYMCIHVQVHVNVHVYYVVQYACQKNLADTLIERVMSAYAQKPPPSPLQQ